MKKGMMIVGTVLALLTSPVNAACWTQSEVAAAEVRDFDTMLMVSGLRCRFQSTALIDTYNAMVVHHRAALTEANMQLKAHFTPAIGGANALDSYITRVANRYGAGAEGLSCETLQSIAEAALHEASTLSALTALAERADVKPELPGGACAAPLLQVAARR
jgi:hypothetical protein